MTFCLICSEMFYCFIVMMSSRKLDVVLCLVTTSSQNSVTVVGSTVTFSCTTNTTNPIRWVHHPPYSARGVVLYNGERMHPNLTKRFHVETSSSMADSTSRLDINKLQLFDAGIYVCRDSGSAKYNRSIELIILASTPTCSAVHSTVDDVVEVQCTVVFYGHSKPNIHCIPGSDSTLRTSVHNVTYWMKVTEWNEDNSLLIKCTISFTNIPSFIYEWTSSVLRRASLSFNEERVMKPSSEVLTDDDDTPFQMPVIVTSMVPSCILAICVSITAALVVFSRRRASVRVPAVRVESDVTETRRHRTTNRKSKHTTDEDQSYQSTIQYDDTEMRPQNVNQSTVSIDEYSQISEKSQEATHNSYESLDQTNLPRVSPPQQSVYDELVEILDNQTSPDLFG